MAQDSRDRCNIKEYDFLAKYHGILVTAASDNTVYDIKKGTTGIVEKCYWYYGETWYRIKFDNGSINDYPSIFWDEETVYAQVDNEVFGIKKGTKGIIRRRFNLENEKWYKLLLSDGSQMDFPSKFWDSKKTPSN